LTLIVQTFVAWQLFSWHEIVRSQLSFVSYVPKRAEIALLNVPDILTTTAKRVPALAISVLMSAKEWPLNVKRTNLLPILARPETKKSVRRTRAADALRRWGSFGFQRERGPS
jgi:hypothetical protein